MRLLGVGVQIAADLLRSSLIVGVIPEEKSHFQAKLLQKRSIILELLSHGNLVSCRKQNDYRRISIGNGPQHEEWMIAGFSAFLWRLLGR
jgi:hypothetical protein